MGQSTEDVEHFVRYLSELNRVVEPGVESTTLLNTVVGEAARLLDAQSAVLLLLDEDEQREVLSAVAGLTESQARQVRFRSGEGLAGWVVDRGEDAIITHAAEDPRFRPLTVPSRPVGSAIAVPLRLRHRTIGVLIAEHERVDFFEERHRALLTFWASSTVIALDNARLYRLALTDPLTGLHNRQYLSERLQQEVDRAHRYRQPLSVLMLDIDRFSEHVKRGPNVGDTILGTVARRMDDALREVDLLSRYDGHSFVGLLPNTGRAGAERAADRVLQAVRAQSVETPNGSQFVTASVGGAVLGPREETRDILVRAEAALFQAKRQGRDRAIFNWLCFASVS
ncbi:MAG: sensor domain-containing diguanylate cyclase [Myxococcota bacterium]